MVLNSKRESNLKYSREFILPMLVSVVLFMEFLDISIINTAIPSIARSFAINPILLKFSVASYFLSLAVFIPISGWCTDKFGTKKIFLFSVLLFVIASFLCAISQNVFQLTIFRFMQGIGGAFMNPVSRIIIVRLFPPKELVRVQGIIFTPALLGQIFGPFLGGLITTYLSWHWIFYINIPIGLFAIYLGNYYIKQEIYTNAQKFDFIGFIITAMSLSSITFFIELLNHYEIIAKKFVFLAGAIGIILFCILVIHCTKHKNAVLDFSLLKIRTFRVGFSVNLSMFALAASIAFLLPLMYQEVFHLSPAKSGFLILPIALGYVSFRMLASKIIHKLGFKTLISKVTLLLAISVILIGNINYNTSIYFIILIEFLFGGAAILIGASTGALNYVDVPVNRISTATSIDITFRQFSSSFGIGISAFLLTFWSKYFVQDIFNINAKVFHYTFYVLAILVLIATVNALKLRHDDGRHALKLRKTA